jgi:hypothetical protein
MNDSSLRIVCRQGRGGSATLVVLAMFGALSGCAHSAPPPRAPSDAPSRDEVQTLMAQLTPKIASCVPEGKKSLEVKLGLDGEAGVVARADVLPATRVVCDGSSPACGSGDEPDSEIDLTVLECVRHATLGKPGPHFKASSFNLSFPVFRAAEPSGAKH